MPNYAGVIESLVAGDFRQLPWQVTNVPANGSVTKAWLTVKEDAADPDVDAKFQKEITTTLDLNEGHITNTGAVGNVATGFFNLISADTILLTPQIPYAYDIQLLITMTDASTRIETPEVGTITTIDGVTDAIA